MAKDLYSILGVPRNADTDTIKKTFRKLAAKLHPDRNPGDKATEARFKEVNHAHDVLSNPKKRAIYDEFGEDGLREGFDPEQARAYKQWSSQQGSRKGGRVRLEDLFGQNGGDVGDIFGDFFGRGQGQSRRVQGQDVEGEVTIEFAEAIRGTTIELNLRNAATQKLETVAVRIPPGAEEGSRIRVTGKGAPSPTPGGSPGNLLLTVHVQPHAHFRREHDDIHLDLPITLLEAYDGAKVRIPTIDGSVTMKVPPHTQSGQTMRLKGKGVARKNHEPGDLYVHFQIMLPTKEDPVIAKTIHELAAFQSEDIRKGIEL